MMDQLFHKIGVAMLGAYALIAPFFGAHLEPVQPPSVGAVVPVVVATFQTSLASSVTNSATSMTLVNGTDKAGNAISGYICFNLDEGTAIEEFVCGTASSTSVTGMIRGLDPVDGTTERTSLKKAHGRGASVKITNYPQLAVVSRVLNGTVSVPNPLFYSTTNTFSSSTQIVTKGYVDGVAIAGAPTATNLQRGLSRLTVAAASSTDPIVVGDNDPRIPTSSQSAALPGTSGTGASSTNKYVDNNDTTATGTVARIGYILGGDGSDGDLTIISGTTTLDLSIKTTYNYRNVTISSGAALAFSNATSGNKFPIIKVFGNFSNAGLITTKGLGAPGGTAGAVDTNGGTGSTSSPLYSDGTAPSAGINGTNGNSTALGGTAGSKNATYFFPTVMNGTPGAGGSGGHASSVGTPGAGGVGASSSLGILFEVNGTFSNTGTIDISGVNGGNGVAGSGNGSNSWSSGGGGGGGGSGAGSLVVRHRGSLLSVGTILMTGGTGGSAGGTSNTGGTGGSPTYGGGGGGGGGGASAYNNGTNGSNGQTVASATSLPAGGAGGNGGDGIKFFQKIY